MTEKRDPPIEDPGFKWGTVVDIGDIRVARGLTRRPPSRCLHRKLMYDPRERRIWCRDCEQDVEAFDAFQIIVEQFASASDAHARREKRIAEAEGFQARTLAAKALDEAWRHRSMVPACPHCGTGLFPEQFKYGVKELIGRDYALAQLERKKKGPPE